MAGFVPSTSPTCGGVVKPAWLGKGGADANCDGYVDGSDYSIWRREYVDLDGDMVKKETWEADLNCDQYADGADYSLWRRQYIDL